MININILYPNCDECIHMDLHVYDNPLECSLSVVCWCFRMVDCIRFAATAAAVCIRLFSFRINIILYTEMRTDTQTTTLRRTWIQKNWSTSTVRRRCRRRHRRASTNRRNLRSTYAHSTNTQNPTPARKSHAIFIYFHSDHWVAVKLLNWKHDTIN